LAIQLLKLCLGLTLLLYLHQLMAAQPQFVIGVGDVIVIDVYNEKDLFVKTKVSNSGRVRIPLIGDFTVVDKTPLQLSEELENAYLDGYLVNPSVSVIVESYRPFYIRGAVVSSGVYGFEFDMTVEQAIAVAGGLKDRASKTKWYIIRGAEKNKIKVSLETKVLPGDVIEIEESLF
jgi:protein involved in polysaccharide export with SLBB domain